MDNLPIGAVIKFKFNTGLPKIGVVHRARIRDGQIKNYQIWFHTGAMISGFGPDKLELVDDLGEILKIRGLYEIWCEGRNNGNG